MSLELGERKPGSQELLVDAIEYITKKVLNDTTKPTPAEEGNPRLHRWRGAHGGNDSGWEIITLANESRNDLSNVESGFPEQLEREVVQSAMTAALYWVYDNISTNAEVKRLDIASIVTNSMLHRLEISLKPDYAEERFHDAIAEGIRVIFDDLYESTEPKEILDDLLRRSRNDSGLLHEHLAKYSALQRFLVGLNALDPARLNLVWATECAMTCSLENSTELEELDIRRTSHLYLQAAEWILRAGADIAATCRCGADLGPVYLPRSGKELVDMKPSRHDYFSAKRWDNWKKALQDIIAKYEAQIQRPEHKHDVRQDNRGKPEWVAGKHLEATLEVCQRALENMEVLDRQRESVRHVISSLLVEVTSGSQDMREKAVDDLFELLGKPPDDPVYINEYVQAHTLEWLSHARYIWVCVFEKIFDWEPTDMDRPDVHEELWRGVYNLLSHSIEKNILAKSTSKNLKNIQLTVIGMFTGRVDKED
ncbi:hypothetical protein F5X99DRAFT_430191 [Biscogniauxia marginata]|nr:hypothetical protein F5X99DRAFT_430191 [Biscogniauxia marginata]